MALISDPDFLIDGTEITITPGTKKIRLNIAGNLSTDGVTLQAIYSKLKELWRTNSTYIKYEFPMVSLTSEQYELVGGWDFENLSTKQLIRTGGWALKDNSGVSLEEWAGVITLGTLGSTDQVYYQQSLSGSATNIVLTGPVNQAIQIFGGPLNGNFNRRNFLKLFVRVYQKSYASSQLSDIGVNDLTYQVYRFPLANSSDLKIVANDNTIDTTAPYNGMSIQWYGTDQVRSIGGTNRNFRVIINGNNGTAEQIYEFVQRQLRRSTDIDAGTGSKIGNVTDSLLRFVGDTLFTMLQSEGGVFIDNYRTEDVNRITFVDNTGTNRTFPFTASITLQFNSNLVNDPNAKYFLYFANDDAGDNTGRDYGTLNAILVNDSTGSPITGDVTATSITRTFAYDTNIQRGASSAAIDAPVVAVALGLQNAVFTSATGTITRSTANQISLVSPQERAYRT